MKSPNVLIIMSDQHNPSVMGCAGDPVIRTPHLDRLASEGMRFSNFYCPAPLCGPSRMSFLTSRRPTGNRIWQNGQVLSSAIPTWAHTMGAAGYETFLFGRMDMRGPDQRHGFEHRPIGDYHCRYPGAPRQGGPVSDNTRKANQERGFLVAGTGTTVSQYYDDRVVDYTLSFIRNRAEGDADRPFAAVVGFWLPHPPCIGPAELFDYYADRVHVPSTLTETDQTATIERFRRMSNMRSLPDERAVRNHIAGYYAVTEYMDRHIGRILKCLDETGLSEDTLVLYTSDHGHLFGEHGCWGKRTYYENSVGVPLLARLPDTVGAGTRCDAVCSLIDIGPTLAEIAGAEPMKHVDGRSLLPFMQGGTPDGWQDETLCELYHKTEKMTSAMIRSGRWKLWRYQDDLPPALFDLEADPEEVDDLGGAPEHAGIRRELLDRLDAVWNPEEVIREVSLQADNVAVLKAWGEAVKPVHEDAYQVPPPDIEDDVRLC